MKENHYSVYIEKVFSLANTLTIKFDYNIRSLNQFLEATHPDSFNPQDPKTWKYYKNVSGEYFVTDEKMHVISLDTLQEIEFNKENLRDHRATRRAYQYGSRHYKELVTRYPNQENLILGILNPVDIDFAINAKEGQILSYSKELVESNEYDFINELQEWIYGFQSRWINKKFSIAHDLYLPTIYSVLYTMLPSTIMKIRHEKCMTNQAHSFHVKEYLKSHGRLDRFYNQLTLKQSLWLYKNLRYIKKNLGKRYTFEKLISNILTARNIPLSEYRGTHETKDMPGELLPNILFNKLQVNEVHAPETLEPIPLSTMLEKEDILARSNSEVRINEIEDIRTKLQLSSSTVTRTKALESVLYDLEDSFGYTFESVAINHWIYLSSIGLYRAFIQIENPRTGDTMNLSVADSFLLGHYLFMRGAGFDLEYVPDFPVERVRRLGNITARDIHSIVEPSKVSLDTAYKALEDQPEIEEDLISTFDFHDLVSEIHEIANFQIRLAARKEDFEARAQTYAMVSRIYEDRLAKFYDEPTKYSEFFRRADINIKDFEYINEEDFWVMISSKCIGIDDDLSNTPSAVQKAMLGIMTRLSSYTIQYLDSSNRYSMFNILNPPARVGQADSSIKDFKALDPMVIGLKEHKSKLKLKVEDFFGSKGTYDEFSALMKGKMHFEINVKPRKSQGPSSREYIYHNLSGLVVRVNQPSPNNEGGVFNLPGSDIFASLTNEERQSIYIP